MKTKNENFLHIKENFKLEIIDKENRISMFNQIFSLLYNEIVQYDSAGLKDFQLYNNIIPKEINSNNFYPMIKNLEENIKFYINTNHVIIEGITFNNIKHNELILNIKNIFSIINVIIKIIDDVIINSKNNPNKYSSIIYNFAYFAEIPKYNNEIIYNKDVSEIIFEFFQVKKIIIRNFENNLIFNNNNINNSFKNNKINRYNSNNNNTYRNENDKQFFLDLITFFSFFFKTIFPNIIEVDIDLNIYSLLNHFSYNNYFCLPYKINTESIINQAKKYNDIFLANFILLREIYKIENILKINVKIYDSYQIELHYLLSEEINNNENSFELIDNNNNYNKRGKTISKIPFERNLTLKEKFKSELNNILIYFDDMINLSYSNYLTFEMDFNSLDPLLFNFINIIILRIENLENLKLKFFPNNNYNIRKIEFNQNYFNYYSNSNWNIFPNYKENDLYIDFKYFNFKNNNKNNCNVILKDEKIFKYLIKNFNENLWSLTILIERKLKQFEYLSLNLSEYQIGLNDLDNNNSEFITSILIFLLNILKSIQNLSSNENKLNKLELIFNNSNDNFKYILNNIKKKFISYKNLFKLNECKNLNSLLIDIYNVSDLINLDYLPFNNLKELKLFNLNENDFKNLNESIINQYENINLNLLEISLDFDFIFPNENINFFIKSCIKKNLKKFVFEINGNMKFENFIEIIYLFIIKTISENEIILKIFQSNLYECYLNENIEDFMCSLILEELNKKEKNICCNCKYDKKNKNITVYCNILNKKFFNWYYCLIYSFKKKINIVYKNNDTNNYEKIFKNIFYFTGKISQKEIKINIIT